MEPKSTALTKTGPSTDSLDEQSIKRIRQAVYDIRYRSRKGDIDISQAYSQYMANTSMASNEKSVVREKLGLTPGGQVSEDAKPGEHYLRVDPRKSGTGDKPYVKKFNPSSPEDRKKRHSLIRKGAITTVTKHGTPSDGPGEKYEKNYKSSTEKNTVGDLDGDGTKEPDSHEYAGVKDNAIKKSIEKTKKEKKIKKESFYSWKDELIEVVEKIDKLKKNNHKITEKNVKNNIIINPDIKTEEIAKILGAELLESVNLGENYIEEVVDYATEYFYLKGLNEDGIDILVEEIGIDNFSEYIFSLDEGRRSEKIDPITKTKKSVASLSERYKVKNNLQEAKIETSINNAKKNQKPSVNKFSEEIKSKIKNDILEYLQQLWQNDRKLGEEYDKKDVKISSTITEGQSEIGSKYTEKSNTQELGRAAGTFIRKIKEDFDLWISELIDDGYDIENYNFGDIVELYIPEEINEGLGTAISNILFGTKSQQIARARQEREKRKAAINSKKVQRKYPSQPIRRPNTQERDPWSGNPETDKAWMKGGTAASSPRAYRREEIEEWMEAFFEEIQIDENLLFLIFESNFMTGELFSEKNDPCWTGYTQVGMKKKRGKNVPNCVPSKEFKEEIENIGEKSLAKKKFEKILEHIRNNYSK